MVILLLNALLIGGILFLAIVLSKSVATFRHEVNKLHFYSARNCIASAVLATAIPSVRLFVRPSVCLSVCHTPVLCQNDGT